MPPKSFALAAMAGSTDADELSDAAGVPLLAHPVRAIATAAMRAAPASGRAENTVPPNGDRRSLVRELTDR